MQACRRPTVMVMPLKRWFRGGSPTLRDRLVKGLQQARDGDADGAIETIAARFSDALAELRALPAQVDAGWLRLAPRPGHPPGGNPAGAAFALQRGSREEERPGRERPGGGRATRRPRGRLLPLVRGPPR